MKKLFSKAKNKVVNFLKDEKSANTFVDNSTMIVAGLVLFIIVVIIVAAFVDSGFNSVGNTFLDGVNGETNVNQLDKWTNTSDGFNRE